jgi:protein gp37
MAQNSKIEWTDHTFNPWVGCTNVSPGCDHCYAESWSKRSGLVKWGNSPRRRTSEAYWRAPLKWQARAPAFQAQHGRRQRVFCASLADVFDNQADAIWRADLFALITATPSLDWLLLTKRPQNIKKMLPDDWGKHGRHNVWLGTTAEDQVRFDQRWPILGKIPASVRFISYEPAIGALRLREGAVQPDWLISGGESGHGARSMNPQWVRDIVSDCNRLGVAPFHKQWGSIRNNPLVAERGIDAKVAAAADTHGKGGGLVDGHLWREFPIPRGLLTVAA